MIAYTLQCASRVLGRFVPLWAWCVCLILLFCAWKSSAAETAFVPVSSAAIFFSPYNTYSDGDGRMLATNVHAGSHYALWVNPGVYLQCSFTASAIDLLIATNLKVDDQPSKIGWSIDGGELHRKQLTRTEKTIRLARDAGAGTHTLLLIYLSSDGNADRWRIPEADLRVRGLRLIGNKGERISVAPVPVKPKTILFFGDSITEGAWVSGTSFRKVSGKYIDWVRFSDASLAWPRIVADTFDAEYGVCAFGGTGWISSADPYVPPMPSSWSFYFAGHSRLINGELTPSPDMVIANLGTNDGDRQTSLAIRLWLKEVRRSLVPETPVVLIVPFGQMNRSEILDALSRQTDPYVFEVDLGPDAAEGLKEYGRASSISFDGLHPNASATPVYAAAVVEAIKRTVGFGLRGQ